MKNVFESIWGISNTQYLRYMKWKGLSMDKDIGDVVMCVGKGLKISQLVR